ncbi:MAG: RdgB/HAM1 family non-canonical purine NTP pyrophosphatase [Acidimicrobiia bacterium]
MRLERLVVASKNPDKIAEISEVLRGSGLDVAIVQGLSWPEVEESGSTLEENALLKARAVSRATGLAALADDTGLFVAALGGEPGVHTARFAGPDATYADNVALLLKKMEGFEDREASFRTVVALVAGKEEEVLSEGELTGRIAINPRGKGGFGYDPVFLLDSGRTLAELEPAQKNHLSHRARALRGLIGRIDL